MTPEQRARKRDLIERLREAGATGIRLTLDEATYLLNAADLPDLEIRLAESEVRIIEDEQKYKTLYEQEKVLADEFRSLEPDSPRRKARRHAPE